MKRLLPPPPFYVAVVALVFLAACGTTDSKTITFSSTTTRYPPLPQKPVEVSMEIASKNTTDGLPEFTLTLKNNGQATAHGLKLRTEITATDSQGRKVVNPRFSFNTNAFSSSSRIFVDNFIFSSPTISSLNVLTLNSPLEVKVTPDKNEALQKCSITFTLKDSNNGIVATKTLDWENTYRDPKPEDLKLAIQEEVNVRYDTADEKIEVPVIYTITNKSDDFINLANVVVDLEVFDREGKRKRGKRQITHKNKVLLPQEVLEDHFTWLLPNNSNGLSDMRTKFTLSSGSKTFSTTEQTHHTDLPAPNQVKINGAKVVRSNEDTELHIGILLSNEDHSVPVVRLEKGSKIIIESDEVFKNDDDNVGVIVEVGRDTWFYEKSPHLLKIAEKWLNNNTNNLEDTHIKITVKKDEQELCSVNTNVSLENASGPES